MTRSLRPRGACVLLSVVCLLSILVPGRTQIAAAAPDPAAAPDAAVSPDAAASPPISEADLARRADTVVRGTVVESAAAWNEEHTHIYTSYAVAVSDAITGEPGPVVRLRLIGGQVGDVVVWASRSPVMQTGEEFVLFLRGTEQTPDTGCYLLCGADAGALKVTAGKIAATGESMVDFKTRVQALARQGR